MSSPETETDNKSETKQDTSEAIAEQHGHDHEGHDHAHAHTHDTEMPMNEACKREISVEIPADVVSKFTEKTIKKYQKLARIPGFRAGKVPSTIIKSRFMDDVRSEVVDALIPEHFRAEVEKQGLIPVSQPRVTDLHFHENDPLKFKAVFEVLPEINVAGYTELKTEKKDISVSEDELTEALKSLQERQAAYDAVEDRELQDGDYAQISFSGTAKGTKAVAEKKAEIASKKKAEKNNDPPTVQDAINQKVEEEIAKPVEVNEVLVEIGGKNTVKDFSDNLRGAKPGDERNFDVTYPDDFNDQRLAGQVMSYAVKIQGVKKKNVPELNDEFAKELGEFATLEELKSRIRENMEAERKHEIEHAEKEKLIDELVAKNDFPVPQALIERQIDVRLERGFRALAAQGMRTDDMRKMNFDRLRSAQKDAAVREVKASLLLDRIAELENLDATEEDIDKELESAAAQSKQSVEALRSRLTKEGSLARLRDRIRNEKALDFLYSRSA
ncbi:MAG: trigger factor [Acidobacteriaceae bacterium]|nr:trigger factor [Acidobacteriaceae bacterium]